MADNIFDQFHEPDSAGAPAGNVFDQFHEPEQARSSTSVPSAGAPSLNLFDQFHEPPTANKPDFSDVRSTLTASPAREPSGDLSPIGDAPPDFGEAKVQPGEMEAAGKEFRRLGSIAGQAAASRTLNLGAMAQQGLNPSESIAAKLTGLPDEYTTAGQTRTLADGIAPQVAVEDRGGRFAEMVGGLAPDLVAATATGGLAGLPAEAGLGARALHGAITMALPAAENTREAYNAAAKNGLTPTQAAAQAAVAGGGTLAMGAIPANVPGDLATRAISGGAIAGLQTEAQRRLANAFLPNDRPDLQQPSDAFNLGAGVLTGGVLSGVLGHGVAKEEHGPEITTPGHNTHFVSDAEGFLREEPRRDTNSINTNSAKTVQSGQPEAGPPPRYPDAQPGSLSHAANVIDERALMPRGGSNEFDKFDTPHGLSNPFDVFDSPVGEQHSNASKSSEVESANAVGLHDRLGAITRDPDGSDIVHTSLGPRRLDDTNYDVGYGGSSQKDGTIVLQRGFDYTIPDGLLKGLDTRPFLAEHEAVERNLEDQGSSYTDSHRQATDAEHAMLLEKLGLDAGTSQANQAIEAYEAHNKKLLQYSAGIRNPQDAPNLVELPYEHPHTEEQRRLLADTERAGNVPDVAAVDRAQPTNADAFQRFFDGSHVVNDDGSPRIVHHGTSEDFTVFDNARLGDNTGHMTTPLGHFLTESRAEAQRYAEMASNGVPADERVISAYASIKNPAAMSKDQLLNIESRDEARQLRKWLEQRGYDGIRLDLGNGKTQWVAFDSGQIKDLNNRGTFERTNPDIRYQRSVGESGAGLPKEEVNKLAAGVLRMNPDAAGVRVVDSFEQLPNAPRKMAEAEGVRNGDIKALHAGGHSWLLADQMRGPADVQEAIFHEHYTHGGLRAKFGRELGSKLDDLLTGVGGEEGVYRIARQQGIDLSEYEKALSGNLRTNAQDRQRVLMEELLAHMSKATGTLKRVLQEWLGAVRDFLRRNGFPKLSEYGATDLAHVLKQARQASVERVASTDRSRPFYQRRSSPEEGQRNTPPTDDELHEAYSIAQRGAPQKMFTYTRDSDHTVVSYNGKEVARVPGEPKRKTMADAVARQLTERQQRAQEREPSKLSRPAEAGGENARSVVSPRRFGESRESYVRRIDGKSREEIRQATSLKAQQRTIGRHAIREMLAKRQRAMDTADAVFGEYRKLFDKTSPAQNFANIDDFETGKQVRDHDFRAFLIQMKPGFVERINRLRELDPKALQHVIEHYVPHLYQDPARAAQVLKGMNQRRSIAGDKSFLEQREWPTLKQAMASGLRPVTNNPVDWVMLRYAAMDKYIGSLELRKELADRGWLLKAYSDEPLPPGFRRVMDPAFNGYAVPEQFARDITNYLDPGFSKFTTWRTLRGIQNFMVAADLGFSGFHATFTSTDNVIMHVDVAIRRAFLGDSRGAATTMLKALTSVVASPFEGHKLNHQWRGIRAADANTAAILDALERGGARWKMSTTEYQNAIPKVARWLRQMQGQGVAAQIKGKSAQEIAIGAIRVPTTALQAVAEIGSYLIHHVLVPNQKMAARVLLYKLELDKFAQRLGKQMGDYAGIIDAMHPDVVRQLAAKANDVVDYRLGQMTYDNRFWNRTAQDIAQAAVMAPGWQFGMLQTVAGAAYAAKEAVSPTKLLASPDKGGKITNADMGRVSNNLTYFVTLALVLGGGNAALQYLLTGQAPNSIKDYFFPRTGRKNDDDSDERLQLPNYWVDHYKLATEPGHTIENKVHPFWKAAWELGHNRDYFGTQIRDPNAPAIDQATDIAKYIASKFAPITYSTLRKGWSRNETMAQQVGHFVGVNRAPARVARSEFQNFVMQGGTRGWGEYTKTQEEAERRQALHEASAAVRRGDQPNFGKLNPRDQAKASEDAQQPVPALLFKHLSVPDKIKAFDLATPEERERYGLRGYFYNMDLESSASFKRSTPTEQNALRARLAEIRAGREERLHFATGNHE